MHILAHIQHKARFNSVGFAIPGDKTPRRLVFRRWPRDRVLGNPRFLLVLFIELAMGCSAKLTAEARQRGDAFKKAQQ